MCSRQCVVVYVLPIRHITWMVTAAWSGVTVVSMPDHEVLAKFSTSPKVEPPEFVSDQKALLNWLGANPDWRATFARGAVTAEND